MSAWRYPCLALVAALTLLFPPSAAADDVLAGLDLFQTDPGTTFQDFGGNPLPADFFDPGSDPFAGVIRLQGRPLLNHSACPQDDLSTVDTIVRRLDDAQLPGLPSSDTVPIEIVALQLVSIQPITVTYNGGQNPELWDVHVDLSPSLPQPQGQMTIRHDNPAGGTFDSVLPVVPRFLFVRQTNGDVRELDLGQLGQVIQFQTSAVPWVHIQPPAGSCTSNFCVNPGELTVEQALLAQHGVLAVCPEDPTPARTTTWGALKALHR